MTAPRAWRWAAVAVAVLGLALGVAGCGTVRYLGQSVAGHLDILRRAQPVGRWLQDPATEPTLRQRLALSQRLRDWAVAELALPDNGSYRRYAALDRPAALWNVVAAPELSLTLRTWCWPVVGCVGYRGFYDRAQADALADQLRAEGLEVRVYGVPAYSTLGWTDWLGGDPLLSTFIRWPEGELARLIFHELSHQVAYATDDTTFNESYATAVERLGVARWLAERATPATRAEYERFDALRRDFKALVGAAADDLRAVYQDASLDDAAKRLAKAARLLRLRGDYEVLKQGPWGGYAGYDAWFAQANNAAFGILAAYDRLVPDFERLFEREGRDFTRFHAAVRALARLPKAERLATLQSPS